MRIARPWWAALLLIACGNTGGGASVDGGSGDSGASTGGSGSGATGGSGGASTGGASTGGASTGGASTGGGSNDASPTGGAAGVSAGGASMGGSSAGGSAGAHDGGSAGTPGGFVCPVGSRGDAPDLTGTPSLVGGVPPDDGFGRFNLEGPVWFGGALYASEIGDPPSPPPARIVRYVPGFGVEIFVPDSGTNGLAIDANGALHGASHAVGGIVRFDWQDPTAPPVTVVSSYGGSRFSSPNDLVFRSDGVLYFTDPFYQAGAERQDEQRAYWVDTSGTVRPIAGAPVPPNGISLSPDESILYVGGGGPLVAYDVRADGAPVAGTQFGDQAYRGVDGMGVDCAGNLYVTLHSDGLVVVLAPSGQRLGELSVGSGVTNVAFGGASRSTLYITKLNPPELYEVDVGIVGLPY